MTKKNVKKSNATIIALNKHVHRDFFIEKEFEAGVVLQGWEVKSIRSGQVNIRNGYVIFKDGEAFLLGINLTPLTSASTHCTCEPTRIRKLLLKQRELNSLYGFINYKGQTLVILSLYWKYSWCKVRIGLATGKKQHDKRSEIKKREWQLNKSRIIKHRNST